MYSLLKRYLLLYWTKITFGVFPEKVKTLAHPPNMNFQVENLENKTLVARQSEHFRGFLGNFLITDLAKPKKRFNQFMHSS